MVERAGMSATVATCTENFILAGMVPLYILYVLYGWQESVGGLEGGELKILPLAPRQDSLLVGSSGWICTRLSPFDILSKRVPLVFQYCKSDPITKRYCS